LFPQSAPAHGFRSATNQDAFGSASRSDAASQRDRPIGISLCRPVAFDRAARVSSAMCFISSRGAFGCAHALRECQSQRRAIELQLKSFRVA
jgi:hypothetical protein